MKSIPKLILCLFVFISCSSPVKEKDHSSHDNSDTAKVNKTDSVSSMGYLTMVGDSAELPEFAIKIELSDKASKLLKSKKESIIVAAYLSGTPKDTTKYMEDGGYAVGENRIELLDSNIARFRGVKISKAMFESLANKDVEVLINVFSGRHSTTLNLLDCDILQKPISQLQHQQFTLKGKLIGE